MFFLCPCQCKGWSRSLISQACLYQWVTATEPHEWDCHTLSLLSCCALHKPVTKQQRRVVLCPSVLSWVMGQLYFNACTPAGRWQERLTISLYQVTLLHALMFLVITWNNHNLQKKNPNHKTPATPNYAALGHRWWSWKPNQQLSLFYSYKCFLINFLKLKI